MSWCIWGKRSVLVKELRAWNVPLLCVSQSYCALVVCLLNQHVLHSAVFFSVKLHEIALLFVKLLFTGYWDPGQDPCGVLYHAHMISFPFAPPKSSFSSRECWENTVKLSLRFIFCQDRVLGNLFHSQDKCYLYGLLIYRFFSFLPAVSDSDQITLGIVSNVLKMWKKPSCSSHAAAGVVNTKLIRFFHFFVAKMWALQICFIYSQL